MRRTRGYLAPIAPDPALEEPALREAAILDTVARHLRLHPQAQVQDDRGRARPLTRQEADQIAAVTLRAAAAWFRPTP